MMSLIISQVPYSLEESWLERTRKEGAQGGDPGKGQWPSLGGGKVPFLRDWPRDREKQINTDRTDLGGRLNGHGWWTGCGAGGEGSEDGAQVSDR